MINEKCTQEQFEGLHEALERCRRTSTTVKVDRAALVALLIDHGQLWAALDNRPDMAGGFKAPE